ncbi:MAG: RidA family protein [Acidimicrobiales bacterium]
MARQQGITDQAPTPVAPYSQAVRIGSTVSVAGQGGVDPMTGEWAGADITAQTVQTFKNVAACLASLGATLDDVIRVEVYLADMGDFAEMNDAYATVFTAPFPTRTTVGVRLPAGMKVEITVLAVVA